MTQTKQELVNKLGLKDSKVNWNLSAKELSQIAVDLGQAKRASNGAISIDTGKFTGRSPKDRFIVKDSITEDKVWWGDINTPFDSDKFDKLYDKVVDYMNGKELYARDSYVCADDRYKVNICTITELPWSNHFVHNMFLRPTEEELENFEHEWLILNAPGFEAEPEIDGTTSKNFAILNFTRKIALVGGTGYPGEMKKGIFSALNFLLPTFENVLSMHCSANIGEEGDTAIFFGLSGTGKTTLSADSSRKLIGDDEHGWSNENTIFNFEGGCYAKTINLTREKEPDIYDAIKEDALLENVRYFEGTDEVNYDDDSVTQNTRVSYPLYNVRNTAEPSVGKNPKNIFFLTCDAFGVLPPISKLTAGQAAFHFVSGYTAKVAGTELGINEPQTVFSACFGAPFMLLHPSKYAEMLSKKMKETGINVWLVNTGWSGGAYGEGERMSLKVTRSLINAALHGELDDVEMHHQEVFKLDIPTKCPGVPYEVLNPRFAWKDEKEYEKTKIKLAKEFIQNFEQFKDGASQQTLDGSPEV